MDGPTSTELLLIACERAHQVECRPQRQDGTDAAVYKSSGATIARRIRAGANFVASCNDAPMEPGLHPARYRWLVTMQAGAARSTTYVVWLDDGPDQLRAVWRARADAKALRARLPHDQRKSKPWGPL